MVRHEWTQNYNNDLEFDQIEKLAMEIKTLKGKKAAILITDILRLLLRHSLCDLRWFKCQF
jgi:hypothetical protein